MHKQMLFPNTLMRGIAFPLGALALGGLLACESGPIDVPSAPLFGIGPPTTTTYTAVTPSQLVACSLVDKAISLIPHGDGISPVTDAETGPGGWRFSNGGGSFVTFAHTLNDNGTPSDPSDDFYDVDAGRSNVAGNAENVFNP